MVVWVDVGKMIRWFHLPAFRSELPTHVAIWMMNAAAYIIVETMLLTNSWKSFWVGCEFGLSFGEKNLRGLGEHLMGAWELPAAFSRTLKGSTREQTQSCCRTHQCLRGWELFDNKMSSFISSKKTDWSNKPQSALFQKSKASPRYPQLKEPTAELTLKIQLIGMFRTSLIPRK
jgi:hypothetical protein